ncbi:MAG: hypothetical protein ACTHJ3_08335 [Pararhizobium sp.]
MIRKILTLTLAAVVAAGAPALAAPLDATAAKRLCSTLAANVDAIRGTGPALVRSYAPGPNEAEVPGPLKDAAFVYDNALAAIALVGCDRTKEARRIADAIVFAQTHDRHYHDGRIRNAYRAGPIDKAPVALAGFWDKSQNRWLEDGYQAGTAVGNVAWAALALLQVHEATHDQRYLDAAERMMAWIDGNALDKREPAGFTGGYSGFEPKPVRLTWKSTEHNIDVMAAAHWLGALTGDARWKRMETTARGFVQAMFTPGKGFQIGTTPENQPAGYGNIVLDVQLWPSLALRQQPAQWRSALDVAKEKLAVDGGFDFNSDRDGMWTEGTAQAAASFAKAGRTKQAGRYLAAAMAQAAPDGWLYATGRDRITTGLTTGPDNEPFYYFRRPHLGATAWAALAALGKDPFLPGSTGQ